MRKVKERGVMWVHGIGIRNKRKKGHGLESCRSKWEGKDLIGSMCFPRNTGNRRKTCPGM